MVRPYGVYLIPSCSALNEGCSTVENNYGNGALIKVVTGTTPQYELLRQNKLIYDDQPSYDKSKDRFADLYRPLFKKYYSVIVVICDFHVVCESYQITHGTMEEFVLNPVCLPKQNKQASMTSLTTKS